MVLDTPTLLSMKDGKTLFMYNEYTFSYSGRSRNVLRCSRYVRGKCEALLRLDVSGRVMVSRENHNHEPPVFHVTRDGYYHRIK